jgi:hypothetical protein
MTRSPDGIDHARRRLLEIAGLSATAMLLNIVRALGHAAPNADGAA